MSNAERKRGDPVTNWNFAQIWVEHKNDDLMQCVSLVSESAAFGFQFEMTPEQARQIAADLNHFAALVEGQDG